MIRLFAQFKGIPRSILFLIGAAFLIHLVNAGFILILNLYLRDMGYEDARIAQFNSYRFLGTLTFAFPLGLFIKGKRLKPFFIASSIFVPLCSVFLLLSIQAGRPGQITLGFILWGIAFMIMNVCSLPYIMRAAPEEVVSEAISLSFSTWSLAAIAAGLLINALSSVSHIAWKGEVLALTEFHYMLIIAALSSLSIILVSFIREAPPRSANAGFLKHLLDLRSDYDWKLIGRVLTPNMIIAVGAGLTIPFINLFFNSVFRIGSETFSLLGALTAGLVFLSTLVVPLVRRRYGFRVAILIPQWTAIAFLVVLALMQMNSSFGWALYVAVAAYMLRQPLMNMAGPVTSELGMKYVGPRNQELISALSSSIWSASWFLSAKIFQVLRQWELDYYQIFLITAAMYSVGVMFYHMLITDYLQRLDRGEISAQLKTSQIESES